MHISLHSNFTLVVFVQCLASCNLHLPPAAGLKLLQIYIPLARSVSSKEADVFWAQLSCAWIWNRDKRQQELNCLTTPWLQIASRIAPATCQSFTHYTTLSFAKIPILKFVQSCCSVQCPIYIVQYVAVAEQTRAWWEFIFAFKFQNKSELHFMYLYCICIFSCIFICTCVCSCFFKVVQCRLVEQVYLSKGLGGFFHGYALTPWSHLLITKTEGACYRLSSATHFSSLALRRLFLAISSS